MVLLLVWLWVVLTVGLLNIAATGRLVIGCSGHEGSDMV
ncbi:MAG: hypothetical protein UX31_C0025G0019 [Candidatus Nomurabacteria bacterium GW2011_GWA1_46_11]|uniref:Uncharacterized protein n=1 Tax=Candidatus Nomurabacteria bacterium GW2011_GWA1_46_11 TaxID=1618732 RepID=A0A0G1NKM0_9BACT|nr:MAG: hypothetical protein UX31_C0025G0019 [Candidatus Nomurabacteria bacterium GW2011_GWA1_46_11]